MEPTGLVDEQKPLILKVQTNIRVETIRRLQ